MGSSLFLFFREDLLDTSPALHNVSEANFRLNSIREIKTPLVSYQCLKVLNLDQNGLQT